MLARKVVLAIAVVALRLAIRLPDSSRLRIQAYPLVALLKKRLPLNSSRYTIPWILSLTLFEKTPKLQALAQLQPASGLPVTQHHPVHRVPNGQLCCILTVFWESTHDNRTGIFCFAKNCFTSPTV